MRSLLRFWTIACGLQLASLVAPTRARADAPGPRATPAHVLGLDSDDAEDQADALTAALRSRVRSAPGWSLQETQHPLGMLTAALRCAPKPDAVCLQRIGDQLHSDHFVWGFVARSPPGQVVAEVHLWSRGHADAQTRETYSDNLKDQNDETLRTIAAHILERLSGAATSGTITVRAGDADGAVWVDGRRKQALVHGTATIELPMGNYRIEVRVPGFESAAVGNVLVVGGHDTSVSPTLVPEPTKETTEAPLPPPERRSEVQKISAFGLIGIGLVAEIVAGVEGARFLSAKSDLNSDRSLVPSTVPDVCASNATFDAPAAAACAKYNDAKGAATAGVISGGVGGVAILAGIVLLVTDHPKEGRANTGLLPQRLQVLPYAEPRGGGGVDVRLAF